MPQMEAISDMIDRAVETGKPIFATCGSRSELMGPLAPMSISGLNVTRYTVRLAMEKGVRPIITAPFAKGSQTIALLDGFLREAAVAVGKPEMYNRDDLRYMGSTAGQYAAHLSALIARYRPAGMVSIGAISTGGESGALTYVRLFGGILISGTARYHGNGPFSIIADYPLIADDVLVCGSYVSGDPVMRSGLYAGDLMKYLSFGVIVVGGILALAGLPVLDWLAA
jgi:hypothetical protein